MGHYIMEPDGTVRLEPDFAKWAAWYEKAKRHVGDDTVAGSRVSTVFLGCDHNWGDGPPILFETMIFGGYRDGEEERYHTREEAIQRHQEIVNELKAIAN